LDISDQEALKQWVIKQDAEKDLDKDACLLDKASNALDDLLNKKKPNNYEHNTYLQLRKKYKGVFKANNSQLENPTIEDALTMDSISVGEIKEAIDDKKSTF